MGIAPAMAQDIASIPDNSVYVNDATVDKGKQVVLSFQMKNSAEVQAIGLYFTLPEGFSIPQDAGVYYIDLSMERTNFRKHAVGSNLVDGEYRVAVTTNNGSVFAGNEGEIFTVTVDVAETVAAGDYEVKLSQVELSGIEGIISNKGEYTGKITVTDPTTSVTNVSADAEGDVEVYSSNGMKLAKMQNGLNIIKDKKTGAVKKVIK